MGNPELSCHRPRMIPYASRTGTRRNLAALRTRGWRLLVSATGVWRTEGFPYAIDNGAWTAHQRGEPFDAGKFVALVDAMGANADWIVLPDIVAGGLASLSFSLSWVDRVPGRQLLAVQDGMTPVDVTPHVGPHRGVFVGGSTDWKVSTMLMWGDFCRSAGAYLHIGRVNSVRRIALCAAAGATSFDGTSASRYAVTATKLTNAARQGDMLMGLA